MGRLFRWISLCATTSGCVEFRTPHTASLCLCSSRLVVEHCQKSRNTRLLCLRLWSLLIWFALHHAVGVTIIFFRVVSVIW